MRSGAIGLCAAAAILWTFGSPQPAEAQSAPEILIGEDHPSGTRAYLVDLGDIVEFRTSGPPEISVYFRNDVNANGAIDPRLDVEYAVTFGGKGCPTYILTETRSSECGAVKSAASYSQAVSAGTKLATWRIPRAELAPNGTLVLLGLNFWDMTRMVSRSGKGGTYPLAGGIEPELRRSADDCNVAASRNITVAQARISLAGCTQILEKVNLNPEDRAHVLILRAESRMVLGQYVETLGDVEAIAPATLSYESAQVVRVRALSRLNRYDEIVRAAKPLIFSRSANVRAYAANELCWTIAVGLKGDLEQAGRYCDAAIEADPADGNSYDSRGMVRLLQHRYVDAWSDYDAAVQRDRGAAGAYYGRGIAQLRLGKSTEGNADLARARAIDPSVVQRFKDYGVTP